MECKIVDGKLVVVIDVSGQPYASKSAIAKAVEKGLDPATVAKTSVASSGGFVRCGKYKVSANVILA